ncbi:UNVERIFIED_CONTAM: hypothetical protein LK11_42790 [Mumia flava]|uniref:hypothetical protein n=1 Tax=Mumia flava TaxID=1348852 RepID=UPI000575C6DE|nr:hypothetical protein [Mumia flava]
MSDLSIDGAMLVRVRSTMKQIEDLLSAPAKRMKDVDAADLGPSELVERVNAFGDEWSYGIEQLGEFSGSMVEALDAIQEAFDAADTDLANALNDAEKE